MLHVVSVVVPIFANDCPLDGWLGACPPNSRLFSDEFGCCLRGEENGVHAASCLLKTFGFGKKSCSRDGWFWSTLFGQRWMHG